VLAEELAAA
jgi:chromosome segregation ATPase